MESNHTFATIHKKIRKFMEASRAEQIDKQLKVAKEVDVTEEDVVMLKQPDRTGKLAPTFSGPYSVKRVREKKDCHL